jgi:predicted transcriptional regulator of viral defense system
MNEFTSFTIANKIYDPSYISLESALRHYNFIPEQTFAITSISTRKTNKFKTDRNIFVYNNIMPNLFFGYNIVHFKNFVFKIADREKAILDYLYFHRHFKTEKDIEEIRFNVEEIKTTIDRNKLENYLLRYNNKSFIKIINNFLNYIYHD